MHRPFVPSARPWMIACGLLAWIGGCSFVCANAMSGYRLSFRLVDTAGDAIADARVVATLVGTNGALTFMSAPDALTSDADGGVEGDYVLDALQGCVPVLSVLPPTLDLDDPPTVVEVVLTVTRADATAEVTVAVTSGMLSALADEDFFALALGEVPVDFAPGG